MRRFIVSLVVLSAAVSAGYAQQKSTLPSPGAPDSAGGGLRGVYGPPGSSRQLRGVYGPSRTPAAAPLSSRRSGSANSSSIPHITIRGTVREGQLLPEGVLASPMLDRPGYGRLWINGRSAIVDLSTDRILQFTDSLTGSPDQLGSVVQPLPASPAPPLTSPLAGPTNSSASYPVVPGYALPAGAVTSPAPYGPTGYGQAFINGRSVLYDRSNNRIIDILR